MEVEGEEREQPVEESLDGAGRVGVAYLGELLPEKWINPAYLRGEVIN